MLHVPSMEGLGRIPDERRDLSEPRRPLLSGAARYRCIHAPHDAADAAETEDALLPERFKWITELQGFSLGWCVRSIDNYRVAGSQKANGNSFESNVGGISIRSA